MIMNGSIEIDSERGTVTIHLDNGSYCINHYTNGIKRFLDDEIQLLQKELGRGEKVVRL